jgi:hypothetical protein
MEPSTFPLRRQQQVDAYRAEAYWEGIGGNTRSKSGED